MSVDLAGSMVIAGSELASALAPRGAAQRRSEFGTVRGFTGSSMRVEMRGAVISVPMTTACAGAEPGDRCIIEAIGATAVAVGVIAK